MEKKGKIVSLQDIADALGLGKSTVSMALNNHSDIARETCRKVREAAKRMGYQRSAALSMALRAVSSRREVEFRETLACLITDPQYEADYRRIRLEPIEVAEQQYSDYCAGLYLGAVQYGCALDFFNLLETPLDRLQYILESRGIHRILVMGTTLREYIKSPQFVEDGWADFMKKYPCTFFSPAVHAWSRGTLVLTDHYEAGRMAFHRAWVAGYRKFFITDLTHIRDSEKRFSAGFLMASGVLQPHLQIENMPFYDPSKPVAMNALKDFLDHMRNDACIVGEIQEQTIPLYHQRLKQPNPPGVIDCDIIQQIPHPRFSGLKSNNLEIGKTSVRLCLESSLSMEKAENRIETTVLLKPDWIDGDSLPQVRNNHLNILEDSIFEEAARQKKQCLDMASLLSTAAGPSGIGIFGARIISPPPGIWEFHDIPFIVEGEGLQTKLILIGQQRTKHTELGRKNLYDCITIPIGEKTHSLYILHGAAFAPKREIVALYRFHYKAHAPVELPIISYGQNPRALFKLDDIPEYVNIQDWYLPCGYIENANSRAVQILGDYSNNAESGFLYVQHWRNPYPKRCIEKVEIISSSYTTAILFVYAITLGR